MEPNRPTNETQARRLDALRLAMSAIVPYLDDEHVIEIALNADGAVWVQRVGERMRRTGARMSATDASRMLQLVANTMNTEITEAKPSLAALIPGWGTRLQAMVPPVVEAPVFTVRKPPRKIFTLEDYVSRQIISPCQVNEIRAAVRDRANILVGGSTGAGKTTLANAILHEIAVSTPDRLYIVEDMRELQCAAENKLQLFVQEPVYGWQRAIMDALRSRPDRIIVGEVRDGAAALVLIKAWNTGHPGGLATVHANDTRAMLDRLCQLVEEVVAVAPRLFIAQTIGLCIHLMLDANHPAGRRLSGIDRVDGLDRDGLWRLSPVA
jgi:type IV secretion system protein TrbB